MIFSQPKPVQKQLILVSDNQTAYLLAHYLSHLGAKCYIPEAINPSNLTVSQKLKFEKSQKAAEEYASSIDPQQYVLYDVGILFDTIRDLITGGFLYDSTKEFFAYSSAEFDDPLCTIMVSPVAIQDMLSLPQVEVTLFDVDRFSNIIFAPVVLANDIKISTVRSQAEEDMRVLKKIDNLK